jgi:hypothetical protein
VPHGLDLSFLQVDRYNEYRHQEFIMAVDTVNTSFITKLASANGGGADLAALKAKLGKLLKLVKDLAQDDSMDADQKKQTQQLLQMQIQVVMQQIAELESKGKKGEAPPSSEKAPRPAIRAGTNATSGPALSSGIDIYA